MREGERIEPVRDRDRGQEQSPSDIGDDHRQPPPAVPVDERPGVERDEQVRRNACGAQVAHLRRARIECQHADERERDPVDLIAEVGDRLPGPEAAERAVSEQGW
jgi:hypothetical protein